MSSSSRTTSVRVLISTLLPGCQRSPRGRGRCCLLVCVVSGRRGEVRDFLRRTAMEGERHEAARLLALALLLLPLLLPMARSGRRAVAFYSRFVHFARESATAG